METLYSVPPLRMARVACELRPEGILRIPVDERGNLLRGAFGELFRRLVCDPACESYENCPRAGACPHHLLFAPRWEAGAQFGLETPPRAFLFCNMLDPDPEFSPDRSLRFELRLFGNAIEAAHLFLQAFALWSGHGDTKRRVRLTSAFALDWEGRACCQLVEDGHLTGMGAVPLGFDRCFTGQAEGSTATIDCLTPMWLKERGQDVRVPTIAVLVKRIRDRLSMLCSFHERIKWDALFAEIGERAEKAENLEYEGEWVHRSRFSSRTDKAMPMGGFVGKVRCGGIDPVLWPLLRIGEEIHAGRFAVWGHGRYRACAEEYRPRQMKPF